MIVITALWIDLRNKTRSYLRNGLKIVLRPSVNLAPGPDVIANLLRLLPPPHTFRSWWRHWWISKKTVYKREAKQSNPVRWRRQGQCPRRTGWWSHTCPCPLAWSPGCAPEPAPHHSAAESAYSSRRTTSAHITCIVLMELLKTVSEY